MIKKIFSYLVIISVLLNCCFCGLNVNAQTETCVIWVEGELKEPSVQNSECGFSLFFRTVYSGCYGNQLEGEAKQLYDAFVSNFVTKRGSSEFTYTLKTPLTFNDKYINGDLVGSDEYYEVQEKINIYSQMAMDAFIYDYPEVFWLKNFGYSYEISLMVYSDGNAICTVSQIKYSPIETYSGASYKISVYDSAVNNLVSEIKNKFSDNSPRKNVLKYIHDYLCQKGYYSYSGKSITHTSEPLFIGDGGVVCEGYADAFKVICDKLGLPCACVVGVANNGEKWENHMWNYVQLEDGKWYLIDITWDDQPSGIRDTYFLANWNTQGYDVKLYDERVENGDFSGTGYKSFVFPQLSRTEYPNATHLARIRNFILYNTIYSGISLDYNVDDIIDARDLVWLKKALVVID